MSAHSVPLFEKNGLGEILLAPSPLALLCPFFKGSDE